jgi:hypothetical protein
MFNLPQDLLSSAYLSQNGEPAWPLRDALKVIDWATKSNIAVFGVEIWLPTTPGPTIPTPYIYTHETHRRSGENWNRFVERANDAAANYISSFDWDDADRKHHGMRPYFNVTLDDG